MAYRWENEFVRSRVVSARLKYYTNSPNAIDFYDDWKLFVSFRLSFVCYVDWARQQSTAHHSDKRYTKCALHLCSVRVMDSKWLDACCVIVWRMIANIRFYDTLYCSVFCIWICLLVQKIKYKLCSLELELDEIMPIIINAYYMLAFFSHSTKSALNDGQSAPSRFEIGPRCFVSDFLRYRTAVYGFIAMQNAAYVDCSHFVRVRHIWNDVRGLACKWHVA